MLLTDKEQTILRGLGYTREDIQVIDTTLPNITYNEYNSEKPLTETEARNALGTVHFLGGIGRCVFHKSSCQTSINNEKIGFTNNS